MSRLKKHKYNNGDIAIIHKCTGRLYNSNDGEKVIITKWGYRNIYENYKKTSKVCQYRVYNYNTGALDIVQECELLVHFSKVKIL